MADVLAELRAHVIKGKDVRVEDESVVFLDVNGDAAQSFPKHALTNYHSKTTAGKRYDLLAVYTCYKYAGLTFGDYVMKCRAEKAATISTVDKKDLIAYLKGDIESSAQIHDGQAGAAAGVVGAESKPDAGAHASSSASKSDAAKKDKVAADASNAKKRKLAPDAAHGSERHRDKDHKRMEPSKPAGESANDSVLKRILERECSYRTRTTVLNASKKTFEGVLKTVEIVNADQKEKIEKASKATTLATPVSARKEQVPLSRLMKDKIHGTPIIVVPAGFSDLFTMLNAKDFLEDGVYIPNAQKKKEGCRKAQSITITHEENGEQYVFKVVDSVSRFRDKDWRCVVGVIASGQSWQFKGWKWKFPLEVFKKVCGIHIYNQGSQLTDEIKQWDVKILMIHPDKRHLDKVAAKEFWRYLFEFIKLKLQ